MRTIVMVAALLLAGGAASAQSQDSKQKPEKEKEKAAAPRKPAPTYTDEDLKRAREGGGGNVTFLPGRPEEPAESTSAGDESKKSEGRPRSDADTWREKAQEHRQAIAAAEASVKGIEERLAELTNDLQQNPGDLFDPSRLQKREAEKHKLLPELEAAKAELAAAKKALADLEEEARAKGIPPGWLQP
jgi:DNA repair exonuclease SbcCD ATPase subunit